jgi:hypothetical protein
MNCEIKLLGKRMMAEEHSQDVRGRLLTYLHILLDGIIVQSTAALNLTNGQHLPLIHHFNGRDLNLIRR